jgi:hypothetical protein
MRKLRLAVYVFLFVQLWQVLTPDLPPYANGDPDAAAAHDLDVISAFFGSFVAVGLLALLVEATLRLVRGRPISMDRREDPN